MKTNRVEHLLNRYKMESEENWIEIIKDIPFLPFKANWEVCPVPPFNGLVARFFVQRRGSTHDRHVSVYLDWYDVSGVEGEPYWEVYPYSKDDSIARFMLNEVDELIEGISICLDYLEKDTE